MTRMWSLIIFTGLAALTLASNDAKAHRIKRQMYGNYGYSNTGYGNGNIGYANAGYGNNVLNNPSLMEYYHRLWDQMHDPAIGAPPPMDPFGPPPPMDPFAPPPPGMDPFAPPPPDPAFDEWAHRMGWIADPAPPPDPAMDDYMHRLAWEHLAFDPTVESELFHGFGFTPNGWLYEHYLPEGYVLSNYG
ncbi:hypothetical protein LOTGIDRAFT_162258 [Lottia gigantea]|uniref:Uncharacterized protein n=1 Tax=Lottia gigantea TaxID=225164 RepID=V4AHA7_LOTGI|nr:hypothetical protein LOTGIDRAFT_162258 [Lottia gigantea]ESO92776.1 hypothetical protein LOTGIDRAFT_162258 [Lottia gigantea]